MSVFRTTGPYTHKTRSTRAKDTPNNLSYRICNGEAKYNLRGSAYDGIYLITHWQTKGVCDVFMWQVQPPQEYRAAYAGERSTKGSEPSRNKIQNCIDTPPWSHKGIAAC